MNDFSLFSKRRRVTVGACCSALLIGLVLAMLFTLWETVRWKPVAFAGTCLVTLIRGLPELLVVLFVYYGTQEVIIQLSDGINLGFFTLTLEIDNGPMCRSSAVSPPCLCSMRPMRHKPCAAP